MIFQKDKPKLYTRCNELPIHNFNEVATNDDFNFLKKNPDDKVSIDDLQLAWLGILDEFIRISKNAFAIATIQKKSTIILLEKKLHVFEAIKLNIKYGNDVTDVCKEYRVKRDKIDAYIGMVKNDIARIQKGIKTEDGVKSETDFDRSIMICNKYGYTINRFTTMVSEWVQALNLIEKEQQQKPA